MDHSDIDYENNNWTGTPQQRKHYLRELLNRVEIIDESEETGLDTASELNTILKQVNIFEVQCPINVRIDQPEETILDATLVNQISGLVLKCVKAVDLSTEKYECKDFASKLLESCEENLENIALNKVVQEFADNIILRVPQVTALFFDAENKDVQKDKEPPKKIRRKVEAQRAVKKELIKVRKDDKEEEGMDETFNFLMQVLQKEYAKNGNKAVDYFRYVMDSGDFGLSVENMFYVSFLIRDGRVTIDLDSKERPTIAPMRKRDIKEFRSKSGHNTQMITSMNKDVWKTYAVQEGLLQYYKDKKDEL